MLTRYYLYTVTLSVSCLSLGVHSVVKLSTISCMLLIDKASCMYANFPTQISLNEHTIHHSISNLDRLTLVDSLDY